MRTIARLALPVVLVAACSARTALPPPTFSAPLPPPRVAPGALEARPLLGDLPQRATHLGAGALAIVASGTMNEGERMGAFVEVPADACLLAYGRATPSLEDIDLAAFAEEGTPVAVDEGPDPRPTLLVCPPHPRRVYVAAHAASGEGLCVIAAQLVPKERARDVGREVGAHGMIGLSPRSPEAWPGLDDMVRTHRASLGGTWEEVRRVAVAVDARAPSVAAFSLEEGGCTDALVATDDDVGFLDVDVVDAEGRLVARASDAGTPRTVTVCSPFAVAGSLVLRPHVGRGLAAVVVAHTKRDGARELSARPEIAWAAPVEPLETTRKARNATLARAGYGAPTFTHNGQLQLGRRVTVPVSLAESGCTRLDVVGGAPLALVDAAVWDDAGAMLGTGEGADGVTLFACGRGKARVDLGARGRPGPFAVLARPEPWRDAAFAAHPLAAGRMLSRAAEGPAMVLDGSAGAVRHASIDAAHQYVHNTTIAPGQCLRLAIGAEGEGTGIEARLLDMVSGEELDRAHGQTSTLVRACAAGTTRSVRLELRATAGRLDAIVGERFGR